MGIRKMIMGWTCSVCIERIEYLTRICYKARLGMLGIDYGFGKDMLVRRN